MNISQQMWPVVITRQTLTTDDGQKAITKAQDDQLCSGRLATGHVFFPQSQFVVQFNQQSRMLCKDLTR